MESGHFHSGTLYNVLYGAWLPHHHNIIDVVTQPIDVEIIPRRSDGFIFVHLFSEAFSGLIQGLSYIYRTI